MNASEVIQKHPYEIAKANKIIVVLEPLGKLNGYYNKTFDQRFIHINENLSEDQQKDVANRILPTALKSKDEMYVLTKLNKLNKLEQAQS